MNKFLFICITIWFSFSVNGKNHSETQGGFSIVQSEIKCATLQNAMHILQGVDNQQKIVISDTNRTYNAISPGGHFRLHWDISGQHAVPLNDAGGNSRPDYIDSAMVYLDNVWDIYINQMNYTPPPKNSGLPVDIYNVYFTNMIYYGVTTGTGVDIPSIPGENWNSYLELENDYAESIFYSQGLEGLKVTCAHEFHHAIQFGYNIRYEDFFFRNDFNLDGRLCL